MKNSIDPKIWGPQAWSFIHYTAISYPDNPTEEDKKNYKLFYNNLKNTLPCLKCSINYKNNINELPIDSFLDSKENLFKWTVNIHNMVNNELEKDNLSYEKALKKYDPQNKNIKILEICTICCIILLILLILYLIKK